MTSNYHFCIVKDQVAGKGKATVFSPNALVNDSVTSVGVGVGYFLT